MGHPLLATPQDQAQFVTDDRRDLVVKKALFGRNTLIVGEPGSGRTSLLHRVEAEIRRQAPGRSVLYLDASLSADSRELTDALAQSAAAAGRTGAYRPPYPGDPFGPTFQMRGLREAPKDAIVLLDNPSVSQSLWFFGSMRDEIWNTPVNFTVATDPTVAERLASPPMDAFFDLTVTIASITPDALP